MRGQSAVASADSSSAVTPKEVGAPADIVHTVLLGETLSTIAEQYGATVETLMSFNNIEDGNMLLAGEVLRIPVLPQQVAALQNNQTVHNEDIITDQELVYGPSAKGFVVANFLQQYAGYLTSYEESVEDQMLDGAAIVQLVADRHSVNPRLLLAILEYDAGLLTNPAPPASDYLLEHETPGAEGLYRQLSWAANMLNWGFYGRSDGGMKSLIIDDSEFQIAAETSGGTTGVQNYFASKDGVSYQDWLVDVGPQGLAATYRQLFGPPTAADVEPLLGEGLQQPPMALPWESGVTWHFSGGPHGGWNNGSAWAALDFVPPDVEYGCVESSAWLTAAADGVIARSGLGAVVLDLDGDGYAGSGWALIYMHLDNRQRIAEGARVRAGDRLGHPGCEGGFTNGTHLHLARTYNGRWISADGATPFNLSGWISSGAGNEYDGWLSRAGESKAADVYATDENAIAAD